MNKKQIIFLTLRQQLLTDNDTDNNKGMAQKQCLDISQQSILKWDRSI